MTSYYENLSFILYIILTISMMKMILKRNKEYWKKHSVFFIIFFYQIFFFLHSETEKERLIITLIFFIILLVYIRIEKKLLRFIDEKRRNKILNFKKSHSKYSVKQKRKP